MKRLMIAVTVVAAPALAQNVAQPWHEPYVGQLVSCKPHPMAPERTIVGAYTFDGSTTQNFEFKKSPDACPMRVIIEPRPQAPASGSPLKK